MGVVYEAEDMKLGRHVALKMLSGTADHAALERFWREARAASALNHPGICTLYEINESEETPFLVMELLEGQSLDRIYGGHAVPLPRLIELGVQIADALDAAHRKGILHRDIKPANIFVTNSGQPKILDFGLARFDDLGSDDTKATGLSDRHRVTTPGSTLGTIAYMSPEQARGETLDARSDVFSLGVVLYEMGTGRHPFEGTTTAIVFDKLLNYLPPAANAVNHELPPEFESIISKALEKDRDLRYQSAADLRADLRRLQRVSSAARVVASGVGLATATAYPGMTRSGMSASAVQSAPPESFQVPTAPSTTEQPFASNLDVSATLRAGAAAQPASAPARPIREEEPPSRRLYVRYALLGATGIVVLASLGFAFFHHRQPRAAAAPSASSGPGSPATAAANASQTGSGSAASAVMPRAPAPAAGSPSKAAEEPPSSASGTKPRDSTAAKPTHPVQHATAPPPPTIQVAQPPAAPPVTAVSRPAPSTASTPANPPAAHPAESGAQAHAAAPAAPPAGVSYSGRHMHSFPFLNGRSCDGNLELTATQLIFTGEVHSVTLTRAAISGIDGNTVIETGGKKWRFEIYGMSNAEVHDLLIKWFNGGH